MSRRLCLGAVFVLALTAVAAGPGTAQEPLESLETLRARPGHVAEELRSVHDPAYRYALYVPPARATVLPGQRWPVLFVMDPRGRALHALERFREAAGRHGWFVVSSYDTRSDLLPDQPDPNAPALEAMLDDADRFLGLDPDRVYLAGFSGTARRAWEFSRGLGDHLAGLVVFGAGLSAGFELPDPVPFPVFLGAGVDDFNHEEMTALARSLAERGAGHWLTDFDEGHGWGPPELCGAALDWLELWAMRQGRRPVDEEWVRARYLAEQRTVEDALAAGDTLGAYTTSRRMGRDYRGLLSDVEVEALVSRAEELAKLPAVRRQQDLTRELERRQHRYALEIGRWAQELRDRTDEPLLLGPTLRRLQVPELQHQAEDAEQPQRAAAARRHLALLSVATSFYLPRELLADDLPRKTLFVLEVADRLHPDSPGVALFRARAHALRGDVEAAMSALEAAAAQLDLDPELLRHDRQLARIAEAPEFQALLRRMER